MKLRPFVILVPLFFPLIALGQLSQRGVPFGIWPGLTGSIREIFLAPPTIHVPVPDSVDTARSQPKSLCFAEGIPVEIDLVTQGEWTTHFNDYTINRFLISSPGAKSLYLVFSPFRLPSGAKLFVYSPNGKTILGAFTSTNNQPWRSLAIEPIAGDQLIVEIQIPPFPEFGPELFLSEVWYDYRGIFSTLKDGYYGQSGVCNVDIRCPPGDNWQTEKHAVCRFIASGSLCTGSLVNSTANDGRPYFLTANHCVQNQEEAQNLIAYFNYESTSCQGPDGYIHQTISGSTLKATTSHLDFCLLELAAVPPPPFHPYYLGWSLSTNPESGTSTIHHPKGDVKKISIDADAPVSGNYGGGYDEYSHWRIPDWEYGTTEGGSSGSPLMDRSHRLIGTLSGGEAYCSHSVNDFYSKLQRAWNDYSSSGEQLKAWLDPFGQNPELWPGFKPFATTAIPQAKFSASQRTINAGGSIDFTDLSTNNPTGWLWTFEGGQPGSSTDQYPTNIIFSQPGTYSISLKAINANGEDTETVAGFITVVQGCNYQSNIAPNETLALYSFDTGEWGYWTGHSQFGFFEFAEKFSNSTGHYVHGMDFLPAKVFAQNSNSKITVRIRKGGDNPGTILFSKSLFYSEMTQGLYQVIGIDPPIYAGPEFFVSYEISYQAGDTFAMAHCPPRPSGGLNTAFKKDYSGWYPVNFEAPDFNISLAVRPYVCSLSQQDSEMTMSGTLSIHPIPARNTMVLCNPEGLFLQNLLIFDFSGRQVRQEILTSSASDQAINISQLEPGCYIVQVLHKEGRQAFRLVKE